MIQNLVYMAARVIQHGRKIQYRFGRHSPWSHSLREMYKNNQISIFAETLYAVIFYSIQRIQSYGKWEKKQPLSLVWKCTSSRLNLKDSKRKRGRCDRLARFLTKKRYTPSVSISSTGGLCHAFKTCIYDYM